MVRKKRQSKRMTLHDKYKIQKKVREHNRKLRRAAKKNPGAKKLKKDPGIPNLWPFKEQLLQEIEAKKAYEEASKQAEKEERKRERQRRKKMSLEQLQREAMARSAAFESAQVAANAMGDMDVDMSSRRQRASSQKTFYKEFHKIAEQADVVLVVLDARDPLGCRSRDVENAILSRDPNKKIVLVLNKIDLVPREVVQRWLVYFRRETPCVAFKSSTQDQRKNLSQSNVPAEQASASLLKSGECLGAGALMHMLKNYVRHSAGGAMTSLMVGVIGFPNVGKSSLINSLKRARAAAVGSTPGLTKSVQEVQLDKNIKLLDCPGIVFGLDESDPAAVLRNAVKVEQVEDPVRPISLLVERCQAVQLMQLYNIQRFSSVDEFLECVGRARGKLLKGGIVDVEATARLVLNDWNAGKIPFYTLPPGDDVQASESDIAQMGDNDQEFAAYESQDFASLPSFAESGASAFVRMQPSASPGAVVDSSEDEESSDADSSSFSSDENDEEDDEPGGGGKAVKRLLSVEEATAAAQAADARENARYAVAGVSSGKGARRRQAESRPGVLDPEEAALNPQLGKMAKKAQKKRRQQRARASSATPEHEDEDMVVEDNGSDYDFDEDFDA